MTSVGARVTYSELLECLTYSLSVREVRGLPIGGCFSYCRKSNIMRRLIVLIAIDGEFYERKTAVLIVFLTMSRRFFLLCLEIETKKYNHLKKSPGSNIKF